MANKKITRRALVMSVISLILCCAMLVGTTFAWFTDSVSSGVNRIQSGNLDVTLEYKTSVDGAWTEVKEDTQIFNPNALYEPGYTEVVFLRVSNVGNLALQYNLNVNVYGETLSTNVLNQEYSLKDYLEIGYYSMDESLGQHLLSTMFGTREAALQNVPTNKLSADTGIIRQAAPLVANTNEQYSSLLVALVLTMPETVGNEANHKTDVAAPTIDLGVSLVATQYTAEEDSFGSNYDENAAFPNLVSTAADLDSMLNEGKNVTLEQDLKFNASETTANSGYKGNTGVSVKGGVLDGNGNTLTVTDANQTWGCAIHTTGGTIKNLTVSGAMRGIFTGGISKDLYIDNVTFKDVIYTFNSDGTEGSCANYGVYISNSTLNGWTSFSDMFKEVVITNCSFGEGSGYAFFRPYGSTEFINCNFAEGYEIDAVGVITFENCTLKGAPLTAENLATLVTSNTANASVK